MNNDSQLRVTNCCFALYMFRCCGCVLCLCCALFVVYVVCCFGCLLFKLFFVYVCFCSWCLLCVVDCVVLSLWYAVVAS